MKKLNIMHDNHNINKTTYYFPFCKNSKLLAKVMKVHVFSIEQLVLIKKLGYSFDLFIKQDKGYSQTIDFLG